MRAAIEVVLDDIWYASDTVAIPLLPVSRPDGSVQIDSLAQVNDLLRSVSFTAHDSVTIGCRVAGRFIGDSATAGNATVTCVAELVDSSNDVVAVLDSFVISSASTSHEVQLEPTLDLLSGTYFVRMRIDTSDLTVVAQPGGSVYPTSELVSIVDIPEMMAKLRRLDRVSGTASRLSCWPNPARDIAEIRFSIPVDAMTSVMVYDSQGRIVSEGLALTELTVGRYAIMLDASVLAAGVYIVELRSGSDRLVEKLVIAK